jgi:hypothetical protein
MKIVRRVQHYQKVCRAVLVEKMSLRGAARYFRIDRKAVDKMHGSFGACAAGAL